MQNILIIGKREPCVSLIKKISNHKISPTDTNEIAYFLKAVEEQEVEEEWEEGLFSVSLIELEKRTRELMVFDTVYIFPDKLIEGIEKVNFFHELGSCKVIVISHTTRYSRIYRQLANFVITSASDKNQYDWLINKDSFTS